MLGRKLGQSAAAKLRQRMAGARARTPMRTPAAMPPPGSARRGRPGSVTPARPQLSQAGMKLAKSLHSK